jgi:hypothetical protein
MVVESKKLTAEKLKSWASETPAIVDENESEAIDG